jgi:hypothetical protein
MITRVINRDSRDSRDSRTTDTKPTQSIRSDAYTLLIWQKKTPHKAGFSYQQMLAYLANFSLMRAERPLRSRK